MVLNPKQCTDNWSEGLASNSVGILLVVKEQCFILHEWEETRGDT